MANLISFIRASAESAAKEHGLDDRAARAIGKAVMDAVRMEYGGSVQHVGMVDVVERNRRVRADFDGTNRDQVCARYGICRTTFYKIIGGKRRGNT